MAAPLVQVVLNPPVAGAKLSATLTPTRSLTYSPSSEKLDSFGGSITSTGPKTLSLPPTDQAGWVNSTGASVSGWVYYVEGQWAANDRIWPFAAYFVLPTGTANGTDVATLPTGNLAQGTTAGVGTDRVINVRDYGAAGDGIANDTAALNAALAATISSGRPLYLPKGIYKITSTLDWRVEGLKAFGDGRSTTIIRQFGTNMPIAFLGQQHQHISDMSFQYNSQAATTDTNSVALQFYKAFQSTYERITTFWAWKGIGLFQGSYDYQGSSGDNWAFSCTFSDIEILGYRQTGIDMTPFNASNTGSVFRNIYVRNGPVGPSEAALSYGVIFRNCDEMVVDQLNIEGVIFTNQDALFLQGVNVVINGLHFEGVTLSAWDGSLVYAYDVGASSITGMSVISCVFDANMNNKSYTKVGLNARLSVTTLRAHNITNNSSQFGLFCSTDGSGSFKATDVDTTGITTLKLGDTGLIPVGKQINDLVYHSMNAAGKHILAGTAAPTTGTWAQGDTVWNTAPTAGGAPGWVCTTAGTPGTWKAMASLAV